MEEQTRTPPRRAGDSIPAIRVREAEKPAKAANGGGDERWTVYDFGASYPLGAARWEPALSEEEEGQARLEGSLDGKSWKPWPGEEAATPSESRITAPDRETESSGDKARGDPMPELGSPEPVRYVRVLGTDRQPDFIAGMGWAAEPADDWTRLFHRREGWTGSDGIYSIPLDGNEASGHAADARTLLLFGDTFIGSVDGRTGERVGATMINNSLALLDGERPDPDRIAFLWDRRGDKPASAIVPTTPKALSHEGTYYWLQDGTSVGGRFHCFPLIVGPDPTGPEGFEFAVHGVARVSAPMGADGPELERQEQADTPLYFRSAGGHTTYFGAAILPLTEEAGAANADGYVYVYGLQQNEGTKLVVARAPAAELEHIPSWTYWDGEGWTARMEDCAPIAPETSTELSVTPIAGGPLDGKYVMVFQQGGIDGSRVAAYVGDGPAGPFREAIPLYACAEPEEGNGIYAYNAKAHPHLSRPGELLVSYNVNTTSWDAHQSHGGIYRPRFIRIRQIV